MEDTYSLPSLQCTGTTVLGITPRCVRDISEDADLAITDLEKDGVVHRKVYPEVPPKVEYMLTKDGVALRPALKALKSWAASRKIPASVTKSLLVKQTFR